MQFLLQLSMTCRMMRLRLLPWIWGRLEFPVEIPKWTSDGRFLMNSAGRLNAIVNALRVDVPLGTNVKYFYAFLSPEVVADSCPLQVHGGVPHVA